MFFIEPHYTDNDYEKYFDIIMYTNEEYQDGSLIDGAGTPLLAGGATNTISAGSKGNMEEIYDALESTINHAVNTNLLIGDTSDSFTINLNSSGSSYDQIIREMETMPYYLIVVKDFALPTLFDGVDTNTENNNIFTFLSGNGSLKTPMCALNSGKTERKLKEE
jgi:hypothetical protein